MLAHGLQLLGVLRFARLSVLFRCAAALCQRLTREIEGDACRLERGYLADTPS
jgi:hypothetical protein